MGLYAFKPIIEFYNDNQLIYIKQYVVYLSTFEYQILFCPFVKEPLLNPISSWVDAIIIGGSGSDRGYVIGLVKTM